MTHAPLSASSFRRSASAGVLAPALVLIGALAASPLAHAQGQGSAPVTIVNPLPLPITGTVSTRDVETAASNPYQARLCTSGSFGPAPVPSCSGSPQSMPAPANRRLVIEYVSGECFLGGLVGSVRPSFGITAGGVSASHVLHLERDPVDARFLDIAQPTRLYADPGTLLALGGSFGSAGAAAGSYQCTVVLSGHTAPL